MLKSRESRQRVGGSAIRTARYGWWRLHGAESCHWLVLSLSVVEVLTTHFGVLGYLLSTVLAADEGAAHGTSNDGTCADHDGGCENDIGTPGHVRHEHQDVNHKGSYANQEGDNGEYEETQKESSRVGWGVKMGDDSHDKHDEDQQGGHGM